MLAEDFGYLRTDNIVYYCAESCYCTILEAMGIVGGLYYMM